MTGLPFLQSPASERVSDALPCCCACHCGLHAAHGVGSLPSTLRCAVVRHPSCRPLAQVTAQDAAGLDYSRQVAACKGNAPALCTPCLCAVIETLKPLEGKGGLTADSLRQSPARLNALFEDCLGVFLEPLAKAGYVTRQSYG